MEIKKITNDLSVSPQIAPTDMAAIRAAGFRAIICNRPDGEGSDQPTHEEIEAAARAEGLEARYLPITSGMVRDAAAQYDGYGSCPLTVERGKIVLAEFGYGGVLKPSFPKILIDGTKPSRAAWFLKERMLPPIYWKAMLRGHEWPAKPEKISAKLLG